MHAPVALKEQFTKADLALIRRTVARDCNNDEFDMFIKMAAALSLNPLRRQIYAFVFHKSDPAKRQLTVVVGIDGLRSVAAGTGNYRPDENGPRIDYDEAQRDDNANPLGIVKAEVTVWCWAHGEWHPVNGTAHWDEYAPIRDGKIDHKKNLWRKMARVMIAKCAEAQALRKAWPDKFSNVYEPSEVDHHDTMVDITPSAGAQEAEQDRRLQLLGGKDALIVDWCDGKELDRVAVGEFFDRVIEKIVEAEDTDPTFAAMWRHRNTHTLREFWARSASDALELKQRLEALIASEPEQNTEEKAS
jgi:phage recombination protein Bet